MKLFYTVSDPGLTDQVGAGDGGGVAPGELVGPVDGVPLPVAPVHPVLEHGDAERVLELVHGREDHLEERGGREELI